MSIPFEFRRIEFGCEHGRRMIAVVHKGSEGGEIVFLTRQIERRRESELSAYSLDINFL
jgi:hypothetical protein